MARTVQLLDEKLEIPKANGRHVLKEGPDGVKITVEVKDGKTTFSGEKDGKSVEVFTLQVAPSGLGERQAVCYLCEVAQGIIACRVIPCWF